MTSTQRLDARQRLIRGAVVLSSLSIIALWIRFGRFVFSEAQNRPAPAAVMLPIFFSGVALGAAFAAVRGDGIKVALAGGVSMVPMGLFLLLFPGYPRLISLLDVSLIVFGIVIMRGESVPTA
jgi:hypothetical protein